MKGICDKTKDYKEKNNRITSLKATYRNGCEGKPITGGPTLIDLITRVKGYDNTFANDIVNNLKKLWQDDIHEKENENNNNDSPDNRSKSNSIQQILIEIANENIDILFKDQFSEPIPNHRS
jgi:hypothetical protein